MIIEIVNTSEKHTEALKLANRLRTDLRYKIVSDTSLQEKYDYRKVFIKDYLRDLSTLRTLSLVHNVPYNYDGSSIYRWKEGINKLIEGKSIYILVYPEGRSPAFAQPLSTSNVVIIMDKSIRHKLPLYMYVYKGVSLLETSDNITSDILNNTYEKLRN